MIKLNKKAMASLLAVTCAGSLLFAGCGLFNSKKRIKIDIQDINDSDEEDSKDTEDSGDTEDSENKKNKENIKDDNKDTLSDEKEDDNKESSKKVQSKRGEISIALPSGWSKNMSGASNEVQLKLVSDDQRAATEFFIEDINDFPEDFTLGQLVNAAQSVMERNAGSTKLKYSESQKITVGGHTAVQYTTVTEEDIPWKYLTTLIVTDEYIIRVDSYASEKFYNNYQKDFKEILKAVQYN